jgi:hypothetical protein
MELILLYFPTTEVLDMLELINALRLTLSMIYNACCDECFDSLGGCSPEAPSNICVKASGVILIWRVFHQALTSG